jgi:hypothetical protein
MAQVFISYASLDKAFALRLARSMELLGHTVWIDHWEIGVGDPLFERISIGLDQAEYVIVVISKHTMQSAWVAHEWQIKYSDELAQGRTIVLPLLIEDCAVPSFFRHKRCADFRLGYEIGVAQLAITLHGHRHTPTSSFPAASDGHTTDLPVPAPQGNTDFTVCYTQGMVSVPTKFSEITVELGIPYIGKISGMWKPDADEQAAAWELYIELVTRIAVAELQPDEGSLREALSSLYAIFTSTRDILHKYGPTIARAKNGSDVSFGYLAITILNHVLRPVLAKWHPLLLDYEHRKEPPVPAAEHERRWEKAEELRDVLQQTRRILINYANILAQVAGIPTLYQ